MLATSLTVLLANLHPTEAPNINKQKLIDASGNLYEAISKICRIPLATRVPDNNAAGIFALSFGANFFVDGAIYLARFFGISEVVIGMSVVALGTSLPELATSAMAAFKKQSSISVGNIVGSNIFNILSILGITALFRPIDSPTNILNFEMPYMIAYGFVLILIAKLPQPVHRLSSSLLLLSYFLFIYLLF